jgi:hypothetical protein
MSKRSHRNAFFRADEINEHVFERQRTGVSSLIHRRASG